MNENNWNTKIESTIKDMAQISISYKWMHIQSSQFYGRWYNILSYICIILGPVAGTMTSINIILNDPYIFPIIITIVAFLAGIVASIIKYSNFEQLIHSHKRAASKYSSLIGNIRRQLSLYRKDRDNGSVYLEYISTSYDDIYTSSPIVTSYIQNRYRDFANTHGLKKIEDYDFFIENMVTELCNNDDIVINVNNESDSEDSNKIEGSNVESSQGQNIIPDKPPHLNHRPVGNNTFDDLNKYSDGKMRYEMKRLMGFK